MIDHGGTPEPPAAPASAKPIPTLALTGLFDCTQLDGRKPFIRCGPSAPLGPLDAADVASAQDYQVAFNGFRF
jgi:hypothetical protein